MKFSKKKVLVIALVVCLVAVISMGTLAWFTDSDFATNKFKVANSDESADAIFSVDVTENVGQDGESKPVDSGYTFEKLLPGEVVTKQPFVTNTGSYDQYIRVTVTISDYNAFNTALGESYPVASLFGNINFTDLELDSHTEDKTGDGTLTYVFYVNKIVKPDDSIRIFDKVLIPTELDQCDFANTTLADGFTIDIFAEAVQTENLGGADNAKAAFAYVEANS